MKKILALPFLALAACATTGAAPADESYHALGTEPFWSVTIGDGRMRYEAPDEETIEVATPAPRAIANGRRFESARFTMEVTRETCSDGMSDREYADTVRVLFPGNGRTREGCGGAILPPEALANTSWSIVAIGDETVSGDRYFLRFEQDRLHGAAGCNGFNGGYNQAGETLTAGPLAMTRMACPGPGMAHEARAAQILSGPVRISFPEPETLVLTGANGAIRLRRAI